VNVLALLEKLERMPANERRAAMPRIDGDLKRAVTQDMADFSGEVVSAVAFRGGRGGVHSVRTGQFFCAFGWAEASFPYRRGGGGRQDAFGAFGIRDKLTPYAADEVARLYRELNSQKVYYPTPERLAADEATALLFRTIDEGGNDFNAALLGWLCDVLRLTARSARSDDPIHQESIFRAYTLLNRLAGLIASGDLQADAVTLQRLITQLVSTTTVPFHGEPVEGLQVMGMLETRNIDFRHVLLLSCNEGNLPRGVNDTSLIPYSIRKAYGLTTIDHKVAIYSYYFHRLLQRADDVTIVYNNTAADGRRGEMSRFLLQLMVEGPHDIRFEVLQPPQTSHPFTPPTVGKTAEVMQVLMQRFSAELNPEAEHPLLTPTAVNSYQRCPLRFYYRYVRGLREDDQNDADMPDNRIFGNIFHEAARIVYQRLADRSPRIEAGALEALLRDRPAIEQAVDQAIRQELFGQHQTAAPHPMELNGLQIINREVIIHYLRRLITLDREQAPFVILDLEGEVTAPLTTPHLTTTVGGRIDRLDMVSDATGRQRIRVIDYKTGGSRIRPLSGVEAIFSQDELANHSDYYLQTFLYAAIVRSQHPQTPVAPALLFIQHARGTDYDPTLLFGSTPIRDIADHQTEYGEWLRRTVDTMFDPDTPFTPTEDRSRCTNCPYRLLCSLNS